MENDGTRGYSPWAEASQLQDAKRDLAAWACRWNRVRDRLKEDPRHMLEQELGKELAPEVEVEVHEERDDLRFLVLPSWPAETPAEELAAGIVHAVARGVLHSESPLSASDRGIDETGVVCSDPELDLVARAWNDPAFREELRSRPADTMVQALGVEWPEGMNLELLEETPERLHVVIPSQVEESSQHLLDERDLDSLELPLVAG